MPERNCGWCLQPLPAPVRRAGRRSLHHEGCAWAAQRAQIAEWATERREQALSFDLRLRLLGEPTRSDVRTYVKSLRLDPCSYCGKPSQTYDHIDASLPRTPGGVMRGALAGEWPNLAGACYSCNSAKQRVPLIRHLLRLQILQEIRPLQEEYGALIGLDGPLYTRLDGRVRRR